MFCSQFPCHLAALVAFSPLLLEVRDIYGSCVAKAWRGWTQMVSSFSDDSANFFLQGNLRLWDSLPFKQYMKTYWSPSNFLSKEMAMELRNISVIEGSVVYKLSGVLSSTTDRTWSNPAEASRKVQTDSSLDVPSMKDITKSMKHVNWKTIPCATHWTFRVCTLLVKPLQPSIKARMGFSSKMVLRTEILPSRFLFWLQLHLIVPSEIQNLLGRCCNVLQRVATCCNVLQRVATCCHIFQDPCPTGDVLSRKMCRISAAQAGPSSVIWLLSQEDKDKQWWHNDDKHKLHKQNFAIHIQDDSGKMDARHVSLHTWLLDGDPPTSYTKGSNIWVFFQLFLLFLKMPLWLN